MKGCPQEFLCEAVSVKHQELGSRNQQNCWKLGLVKQGSQREQVNVSAVLEWLLGFGTGNIWVFYWNLVLQTFTQLSSMCWSQKDRHVCTTLSLKAVRIRDVMASVSFSISRNKCWLFIELILHAANLSSVNTCLQACIDFWDASADSNF